MIKLMMAVMRRRMAPSQNAPGDGPGAQGRELARGASEGRRGGLHRR